MPKWAILDRATLPCLPLCKLSPEAAFARYPRNDAIVSSDAYPALPSVKSRSAHIRKGKGSYSCDYEVANAATSQCANGSGRSWSL
jgi:hypothetical protein